MPLNANELLRTAAASDIVPVSKNDDLDLNGGICRGLWVGTAGTANIRTAAGAVRTGVPLIQGVNPIMCVRVLTGGTATDIWAMY